MVARIALSWLLVVTVACASEPGGGGGDDDDGGGDPLPEESYQVQWGPLEIQPGVERVQCVTVRLGNDVPIKVNEIRNELGDVSHHLIVYKAPSTDPEQTTPYDCDSIEGLVDPDSGVPLMITQKAEESLRLPDGVAFELERDQMIRLELHYINADDEPIEASVVSSFHTMSESEFEQAADFVFVGSPDIDIPPQSAYTLGPVFTPLPWELYDGSIFGVTGHQHQWGQDVYVAVAESPDAPDVPIYDLPDFNWDEPATVMYDPPIQVPEAGGFRFTCEWFNGSDRRVGFGEGVDDEMCFFWAYYYPSKGAITCFHTDQLGDAPLDICCPGHQLCNLVDELYEDP